MTFKNKIIKLISAFLIISIMTPVVLFSQPKKVEAAGPCPPGVSNVSAVPVLNNAIEGATGTTCITTVKGWMQKLLEVARMAIAKRVLEKITQSTINWINSGFHGSPLFLENPDSFFKDIAKFEVKSFVDMFGYDRLRYPFGRDFALNAINSYRSTLESNMSYTLSGAMSQQEAENFRSDFSVGGWNGFLINTQYPQNNYLGFQIIANDALARQLAGTFQAPAEKIQKELDRGQGFLSPQKCIDPGTTYNNMYNQFNRPSFDYAGYESSHPMPSPTDEDATIAWSNAQIAAINEWSKTNECKNLVNTTPGSVVADRIMNAMSSDIRQGELAQALGNSLSAIFDALLNKFLGDGLDALANTINPQPSTEDNWSYDGNTLEGGAYNPAPEVLNIPQNVSARVGQSTSTTISGGTAPYVVDTAPDIAIATATISGATLTITGVAPGETTVVVKDSSFPIKRATVRITIVGSGDLMVIPANIAINANDQISATISGGTAPYAVSRGPNETVAMALLGDTVLVVSGVAPGQTSVVIKDSSSPAKTVTINITVVDNQTENLTVTLAATPRIIRSGQSSTLTWSSTNATSCSSSWGPRTIPVNGSAIVSPTITTDYAVTCYGANGTTTTDSATVNVNP